MSDDSKRDLNADLAVCQAASAGPWTVCADTGNGTITEDFDGTIVWGPYECPDIGDNEDAMFIAEARTGWPHAIERAIAAEAEVTQVRQDVIEYGTLYQRHMEIIREQAEEVDRLRNIIARLRCAECGDELGDNWTEVDGEVLCEYCGVTGVDED